ncbi:LiaG family protein [Rossellomorea vietnamensis]|uniref:LiaG family protein n=1 Tax=Rossellomorea vietnamensis TaxID=218284 RepID=UPI003D26E45D
MKNAFAVIIALLAFGTLYVILNDNTSLFAKESRSGERIEVTNKIKHIDLDLENSDTEIIPTDKNEVKVDIEGKGTMTLAGKGDTIDVAVKHKWYEWIGFNRKSNVTVYVPKEYDHSMKIDIGSGNFVMAGESDSKKWKLDELSIDMGSGNMELENIETNVFEHDGSSGDLVVSGLSTEDGKVEISSGDVELSNFEGPLEGDLSSGELTVTMDSLKGDLTFDVSSGGVKLDLPEKASFKLKGQASSGDISCNFPLKDQKIEDGDISGVSGSGQYIIDVSVSSGNVDIY